MERQPIYLLINTSTANQENFNAWSQCVEQLVEILKSPGYESASIQIGVLGFDSTVKEVCPLTDISSFTMTEMQFNEGQMWIGAALLRLKSHIANETEWGIYGDPIVFIFTDKDMDEDIRSEIRTFRSTVAKSNTIICTSQNGKRNKMYGKIAGHVVTSDELDEMFIWSRLLETRPLSHEDSEPLGSDTFMACFEPASFSRSPIDFGGSCLMGFMMMPDGEERSMRSSASSSTPMSTPKDRPVTYEPTYPVENSIKDLVYSSVFAPAEVKRKSRMITQIYLHLPEDTEIVCSLAKESQKRAERRDYIPLSIKIGNGDKVDIEFSIYGEDRLMSDRKSVTWHGTFTKCSFNYLVPEDLDVEELYCEAQLSINGVLIGEMSFTTEIVDTTPRNLRPEIISHRFDKIFISYAHEDATTASALALAYQAQGADYFFDRHSLKGGDVYDEEILNRIDKSDLFILCWSQNAARSEYVTKERKRAMSHAYPQKSRMEATLKIYPISIHPKAELPEDMRDIYNFVPIE